jgi:heat shock protein HtpX
MGPDTPAPVLVYDRIDANRRSTRLLLGAYVLALLPFVSGMMAWIAPWMILYVAMPVLTAAQGLGMRLSLDAIERVVTHLTALGLSENSAYVVMSLALEVVPGLLPVAGIAALQYWRASRMVLRRAGARPLEAGEEPELRRSVENLSIGAGLPAPQICLIDSPVPNALATGRDPAHASLAFTRGLLALLGPRELDAVVAHELSHIGNQDTRLGTLLVAAVRTLRLPCTVVAGVFRAAMRLHWVVGLGCAFWAFVFLTTAVIPLLMLWWRAPGDDLLEGFPPFLRWWAMHNALAALYIWTLAPVLGQLLRLAVSRQREFLADADAALLTRDPEGLALALAKIEAAASAPLRGQAAASHLYIVDPVSSDAVWLDRLFSTHPSSQDRIDVLARMGAGTAPETLERARASVVARRAAGLLEVGTPSRDEDVQLPEQGTPPDLYRLTAPTTPLHERAHARSPVVAELPSGTLVVSFRIAGRFLRVAGPDQRVGWIALDAPRERVDPRDFRHEP